MEVPLASIESNERASRVSPAKRESGVANTSVRYRRPAPQGKKRYVRIAGASQ
jgi:hypothetical protein